MYIEKLHHIFISHAWKYGAEYDRLVNLLDSAVDFTYRNYSAPKDNPLKNLDSTSSKNEIEVANAIVRKIRPVGCVLVISGMYTAYSKWMKFEIDVAKSMGKPIIGIEPWGSEKTPLAVSRAANEIVKWNTNSIVSAILKYST